MSTPDPAAEIAEALARLRGRRPHGHGHGGPHGHHGGPHEGRPFRPGPWAGGPGGRFAAPAWMRMLEALAAASAPLSVSELADAVGVDQPRASRLVQQGVERGFVQREADPDDGRRTRIALTDAGVRVARGARGERRQALSRALEAFTDTERTELARLLNKLADNWASGA
ncbi:MarR family winged helix-turn-helix transcriptional regulator [Microbacterium sp. NPDC056234]|uniref:MarR family winged helix-turn-helix transcriptional regulator n=1 Tax=Microbacterium sp. NPDC056234 TaxID=3345757 RepID=UPI0035D6305C